jgi:hypothetical protein
MTVDERARALAMVLSDVLLDGLSVHKVILAALLAERRAALEEAKWLAADAVHVDHEEGARRQRQFTISAIDTLITSAAAP